MINPKLSRRKSLRLSGAAVATTSLASLKASEPVGPSSFNYCLNMSTIRGQKLNLMEEIDIAGKAGYNSIEPWINKIADHAKRGGKLSDVKNKIADYGMTVESAIGFARWIVDDKTEREKGFEQAKVDMDLIAQIGGTRLAAPPAGANKTPGLNLDRAAERYRRLLILGEKMKVVPQIEVWGQSANLNTIQSSLYVALASGHPDACLLGDVYHFYKGGSSFDSLRLLGPHALQVFHMNDYPAEPPQATIRDEHRVYPGDGIAPMKKIFSTFAELGVAPVLSLELFNKTYWKQDAMAVAKTGLQKMKKVVSESLL